MKDSIHRVTRSKAEAKASYNRMSRWYDAIAGSSEKKYRELGLKKLDVRPDEHVLEIGFGTGHCLVALARSVGPAGKVYGLDLSEGMMEVARQRLQAAGLAERVELHLGDAAVLPFPPESFHAVFLSFTLELFDTPEIPQVLAQCHSALKPDGRLGIVTLVKQDTLPVRIYEWFHEKMPGVVDCRPIFALDALRQADFAIQDATTYSMWGLPVEIVLARKA
ncbi:MAG: class I SAM-dependent methyltransferase [Chloroflexota bacterium]